MLHVGTSGFSYDDWRWRWYPPDLPRRAYFEYYAERFSAIEINSTFYHIYRPSMMASLVRRATGRLRFAVKMVDQVTHRADLSREVVLAYAAGIEPAASDGVLDAVLLQFPQRFHWTPENRSFLDRVREAFPSFPLVFEPRHRSWREPDAWRRYLRDSGISLCLTDAPDLVGLPAPTFEWTGTIGYVRFHGRNSGQWYGEEAYHGARYDYDYTEAELRPWVEPIQKMRREAATALVFFNNHARAQAPRNAEMLLKLLGAQIRVPSYRDFFS